MWTLDHQQLATKAHRVVAAIFFDALSARDAIADLKLANFHAHEIAVAGASRQVHNVESGEQHLAGRHSILWRLRHSFETDAQTSGPGMTADVAVLDAHDEEPAFTEVDLTDTLTAAGVATSTIQLIRDGMGEHGYFIMVDTGDRPDEVESILVRNRGTIRTAMATESSAEKLPLVPRSTVDEGDPAGGPR